MKKLAVMTAALLCAALSYAQAEELKAVALKKPDMAKKATLMDALSKRSSAREFNAKKLSDQDLADLLWAGNGINRPSRAPKPGRTAPSARDAQDIDIYAITPEGAYLYDAKKNTLEPIAAGDFRAQITAQPGIAAAPVNLILVSDLTRLSGDDAAKASAADMDAGIVSQNISLFCAAAGLATVPRGMIEKDKVAAALKLKATQKIILNHPVGY
ncbi:MAG: SagB/ThcOx family dehydrogenase, partial [Chitinispirillales bacterium]|nr:SagB/ThcOx family dehydrogenase [Chitinispirillales bacterium]